MQKPIEKIAEENERRIVNFTNIDKEDFTHSFRGISITVRKGVTDIMRFPEADHLATHLARKMISREKKEKGGLDKDPKGTILWTKEEIDELKKQILKDVGTDTPQTLTPEQAREKDREGLKKDFGTKPKVEDVTKAQIIEDLKKKGVDPDVKKSKEELLQQLMDLEAQGK